MLFILPKQTPYSIFHASYKKNSKMKNWIFLLLLGLVACSDTEKELNSKANLGDNRFTSIELIDTLGHDLSLDTAWFVSTAAFQPLYMGRQKDVVTLYYEASFMEYSTIDWDQYKQPDSSELRIFVDTSRFIASVNRFAIPPPPPPGLGDEIKYEDWVETQHGKKVKSYPVYLKNISQDTLNIGYGDFLNVLIEARDSTGEWRAIQRPYIYFCGTGLSNYFLPPNEIALTSCKLFHGDYETSLRLVFAWRENVCSNEFPGKIDYRQLGEARVSF